MNRRTLLSGSAVAGGALAAMAIEPAAALGAKTGDVAKDSPNLNPPVVQVTRGKLRGFRDGKTSTFLGIPYAEAERFEMPERVGAMGWNQERAGVGPGVADSCAGQAQSR